MRAASALLARSCSAAFATAAFGVERGAIAESRILLCGLISELHFAARIKFLTKAGMLFYVKAYLGAAVHDG